MPAEGLGGDVRGGRRARCREDRWVRPSGRVVRALGWDAACLDPRNEQSNTHSLSSITETSIAALALGQREVWFSE
ncbi:hypothetical protein BV22DRAFT_1036910 [Leucogyrophana mollusca]|uniref:Uncharacterized protein n=1 Tax=Leucogyrophana mollusca TaxID=85980 RepID=A0ACB8BBK0_9AGAM|nr:hypothetical protein BV22DRAFT_1036910 [Leucogyrophana mollusca]